MAKVRIIDEEIANLNQAWAGKDSNGEWGYDKKRVEERIKTSLKDHEGKLEQKVSGLRVNNQTAAKDINGVVDITLPVVDSSLSEESSNAVQNAAVTHEMNSIKNRTVSTMRTDPVEGDSSQLDLVLTNEQGVDFASVRIPAASEVGTVTFPRVTTELLTPGRIKQGDNIRLRWSYDHIIQEDGAQQSSGTAAQTVTIRVLIGATEVYSETRPQVPAGTTDLLTLGSDVISQAGTVNVYVMAQTVYGEESQRAQGFKSVTVITMDLATSFDPASALALSGGYTDGQTITIPYTYTVPSGTTIRIYLDGKLYDTATVSGTARGNVYITGADIGSGRHNVQLVADSGGLLSNAVCVDVLKSGGNGDYLGMRLTVPITKLDDMPVAYEYGSDTLPMEMEQFGTVSIDYAAWQAVSLYASIVVAVDGVTTQTLSADRGLQSLAQRFDTSGTHRLTITVGNVTRTFAVTVSAAAGVTESETIGYKHKLTATGRTNNESEATRSDWGGITTFDGVDFKSNGWNRGADGVDAMLLTNGAVQKTDIKPFVLDAADNDYSIQNRGMTFEMELEISQVMERGATVVSCLWDNDGSGYPVGIRVTTEEAGLYFGGVEEITTAEDLVDANGNYIDYDGNIVPESLKVKLKVKRPHGVSMNISADKWLHLAFVIQPVKGGYGLAMLFINGVLSRANLYSGSLRQTVPQMITIDSDKADVRVRGMRYYRTDLTADETLGNWIIDRPTAAQIQEAHRRNAVGDSNNTADEDGNIAISRDALLGKGRGTQTIIRSGDSGNGLTDLFSCVDKKQNFRADYVRWDPPLDANGNKIGQGFEARNVRIRIQGTSSVKYPFKNIRLYLTTAQDGTLEFVVGGEDVTDTAKGYALRGDGNSVAQAVLCLKTDFVDSSLTLNTGGAHLFDNTMRALGLLTPPQEYDARVRQSIDGIPCDVFCGRNETGALAYCGQFVLNNEKSKSGMIFGMEGVEGFSGTDKNPMSIALEALNNSSPMTLFQPAGSANSTALDKQLNAEFDNGFEFNFPEDAVWNTIDEGTWDAGKNKWSVKPVPGARDAIKRLMGWIYDCVPQAMRMNPDYGNANGWSDASKAKWKSDKFKNEASQYFNISHLLTYYLFTDYWASVDQRAKNILWRTWDGLKWWATYYDGDTAQSLRNDAFMVYLYNITRDSYDSERAKYAFEGHSSWLWCLVLANCENELRQCAINLRNQLTTEKMLAEFNGAMQGNWSERQYNKSGKLKYIDTIQTMNYVYTLTGNREAHRTAFLTDRARLLDSRYGSGDYNGDVITFTVVRKGSDPTASLKLKSGDLYYFGYKLNGIWLQGPERCAQGEELTLRFTQQLSTNDPLMLGGASCIKELDLTGMGSQLNGTVNLSLCAMLTRLVMPATEGIANAPLIMGNISKLQYIDVTGQTGVNTGSAGVFDVSRHSRLTVLKAGGTSFTVVKIAEGAPVITLTMPSTLTMLTLRYLPELTHDGLTLENAASVRHLNFAECPHLDWRILLKLCPNIDHVRIEGMRGTVHSSALRPFMQGGYMGLTATGSEQTYPALLGSVRLEDYTDDANKMVEYFERCGLSVELPEYTMIEFDDDVQDDANISNLDNKTGYKYGTKYEPNGHITAILKQRHRVLAKVTKKATTRNVNMANVDVVVNNTDGEMVYYPLDDSDSNKYADGTEAKLDGTEGDWMMFEPFFWSKGINDILNAKKYSCYSSRGPEDMPTVPVADVLTLDDIKSKGGFVAQRKILVGRETAADSYSTDNAYSVCKVDVSGRRRVRFPSVPGTNFIGSIFTDDTGVIVDSVVVQTLNSKFEAGMYVIYEVPADATTLHFTILNTAEFDKVVLSDSEKIEDMEPDWVANDEHLCAVVGSTAIGQQLRACISGGSTTSSLAWTDFHHYSQQRGMQQIDALMHSRIANLSYAKYGRRDMQEQCGAGQHTNMRRTGGTAAHGMTDTIGYKEAHAINENVANSLIDGLVHQYAWYKETDEYGNTKAVQVNNICCLGYEDIYGNKYDMMDGVDLPNTSGNVVKWRIWMPDGSVRWVKGTTNSGLWIVSVAHGKYMDVVPVGNANGSSSTYYTDMYWVSSSIGRVVYRGQSYANAYGGVSSAYAIYDASLANAYVGSRLAFRGKVVKATSVEAYKAIIEVA